MAFKRGRTIELVSACVLFGAATALSLGQGGGPPIVPKCNCLHQHCAGLSVTANSCSCCHDPTPPPTGVWHCKACTINFDCVNPPSPYDRCLEGGV